MDQNATPQQIQKILKLCDILGLQDFYLASTILQQMNWSLEKAIQMMQDGSKNQPAAKPQAQTPPQNQNQLITYDDALDTGNQDEEYFQYEYDGFDKEKDFEMKKESFDEAYEKLKLDRTSTQPPLRMERSLSNKRHLIEEYGNYRHSYQVQLQQEADKLCKKILGNKFSQLRKVQESKLKNYHNRQFITYLHRKYKCRINFTFGTFLLNLVRSYLDKKYLLVYIHKIQFEESQSVKMFLTQKQFSNFINKNCVAYGMFDNSDDYDIINKYVPLKDLPAFVLFKYNGNTQNEKFISSYPILQKQPESFIEWLADNIGVHVQKKSKKQIEEQKPKQQPKKEKKVQSKGWSHTDVMKRQNQQYQQMERIYKLRRQESKIKKQQIEHAQQLILKKRQKFSTQPVFEDGKTIQIKFRLPQSGKSINRIFELKDKVIELFDYVDCFGRDEFEQRFANFDLTQTFPKLSLLDKKEEIIEKVFEGSNHENLIVKQL